MNQKIYFVKYSYNLQWFAKDGPGGEKTEPATAKKLKEARDEGQVAKSKELASAMGLFSFFLVLKFFIASIGTTLMDYFGEIYNKIPEIIKENGSGFSNVSATNILNNALTSILVIVAPVFAIGFAVALLSDIVQVRWNPTSKPLQPKLSKLDPKSGFQRIFSMQSIFELVKSVIKIGLILYVAYSMLKKEQGMIFTLYDIPLFQSILLIGQLAINVGMRISLIYFIVGAVDFIYMKFKFTRDMKMTKQEIKDEFKNTEGNPEIKGRQKRAQRDAAKRRMMQSLPTADVVITNPTHFSVAVKYDSDKTKAPVVVAKGEDYLALKIREIAKENKIEIVENKPLARMLYANVEVGAEIPQELYQAVAEVLAFVYNLKQKK